MYQGFNEDLVRMLGCARMRLRSARVCSHACVRASSVDFVCRVRVPAHICARACVRMCVFAHVKRIRDPARKLVRVKRDKGARGSEIYLHHIYICIVWGPMGPMGPGPNGPRVLEAHGSPEAQGP